MTKKFCDACGKEVTYQDSLTIKWNHNNSIKSETDSRLICEECIIPIKKMFKTE